MGVSAYNITTFSVSFQIIVVTLDNDKLYSSNTNPEFMKPRLFLLSLAGLMFAGGEVVSAQRTITPFTPRVTDSTGKKVYVQPQKVRKSRIAVTFGYGYSAVTSYDSYANKRFPFVHNNFPNAQNVPPGHITGSIGTISIGFNYEITPWLELNVPFVYSHNSGRQEFRQETNTGQKDNWVTLLPNLRINWMRNNWLSVYSRVGVGLGLGNRWVSVDQDQSTKAIFAYQVSPVGIEMGKGNFCFFVEGGYGFTGAVTAGIKLKVGKLLKSGKMSTGRQVNWYDKYLH